MEEVKVEGRFEFGCGKQNKWYKGRERNMRALEEEKLET